MMSKTLNIKHSLFFHNEHCLLHMSALCQKRTFSLSLNWQNSVRIKTVKLCVPQSDFQVSRG